MNNVNVPKEVKTKIARIRAELNRENKEIGEYDKKFDIYLFDIHPFIELAKNNKEYDRAPIVRRGFRKIVQDLDPKQSHSLDYKKYIHDRIPRFVIKDIITNKMSIELHKSSLSRSFKSFYDRGYKYVFRIETPEGESKELYLVMNAKGKYFYCLLKILGEDKLTHLEAHIKLAGYGNKCIDSDQLTIYDFKTNYYRKFNQEIDKFFGKKAPDILILDGKNALHRSLLRRVQNQKRFEKIKEIYGQNNTIRNIIDSFISEPEVYDSLVRFFEDENIKKTLELDDSRIILKKFSYCKAIEKIYFNFVELESKFPHITTFPDLYVSPFKIADDVFGLYADYNVITIKDKQNKTKRIMNAKIPFGELSSILVNIVLSKGVKNIFFYGSAGGLKKDHKVGDIDIPSTFYDERENLIGHPRIAENDLLKLLRNWNNSELSGIHLDTKHASVSSPLEEFRGLVLSLKKSDYDEIEIEATDVLKAIIDYRETTNKNVNLGVAMVISDVPLSPTTLEGYEKQKPLIKLTTEKVVDILFQYYNIEEIMCKPIARIKFKVKKVSDDTWEVMRNNKRYKFRFLERLSDGQKNYEIQIILGKLSDKVPISTILKEHKVCINNN